MKNRDIFFYFLIFIFHSTFFLAAKKIVVTGGAGFIGSHVAEKLLDRGDSVVIIDNLNDGYDQRIKLHNLLLVAKKDTDNRLVVYKADICNSNEMEEIFKNEQPDLICHLAARAGVRMSLADPHEYFRTNLMGTLVIFEMARKFTIPHMVCASSSSVYGVRENGPFNEDDPVDKQSSPYGMTKRAVELLSYVYHYLFGISITNLRFFTVYGPRGRMDMAPFIFMDAIYSEKIIKVFGDGSAIRDFTYIDDIVDGIVKSLDIPCGYEILNPGRGEPLLVADFVTKMEDVVGKKAIIEYVDQFSTDVPLTHADITKAQLLIGYDPRVSVSDGLSRMYEWYIHEYLLK